MTEHASLELAWVAPHDVPADALPHPNRERWQPLRLGLVDLFYYDDEQFWFHDGRLLLRGNNGTGKSKVLALTLPLLLDGSVAPRRVEPDADPKKRMEWNLLLGGAHPNSERTGYAWVEFGRLDDEGDEQFLTLGIGLKAAAGRGIVKTWYFTTSRRIGDLRLIDADRIALTQDRLRDELEPTGSGQVYTTQQAYRRAVDEALFRLGEERYAALVDLLIQLRQPQLSKKPDERALAAALTEALTPLDQAVIADVAESFRSLEEERNGIAAAKQTLGAAEDFLHHYRSYARIAARRRTTAVREANSAHERVGRDLHEAEGDLVAAENELDHLATAQGEVNERQSALDGERQALQASPAMKDATRLEEASRAADDIEERAADAESEVTRARQVADRDAEIAEVANQRFDEASADSVRRSGAAVGLAVQAGLVDEHDSIATDEQAARRAIARRREQVTHVRRLVKDAGVAEDRMILRRTALDDAETETTVRSEAVEAAEASVVGAVQDHRDAVRRLLAGLRVLSIPGELSEAAEAWAVDPKGESPAGVAVEAAARTALEEIGRQRAQAEQEEQRLAEELAGVTAEITALEEGRDPEPPSVPGREAGSREGRAGAPLWRLVDFADGLPAGRSAGLEAALTSAGLLDAWVFPDGTVSTDADVVLGPSAPPVGHPVATILVPAVGPDAGVGADAVAVVLARIGLGEGSGAPLWVDTDGSWGAGPARGRWSKQAPEFIGAGAREQHRRALLATLRERQQERSKAREVVLASIEDARTREQQVVAEKATYPAASEREVFGAHERAAAARGELARAQEKRDGARARWEHAVEESERAAVELTEQAAQLDLGTTDEDLESARDAVSSYAEALVEVRNSTRLVADAERDREQAVARAAESAELQVRRERELGDLRRQAASLRARFEALHSTVGASVADLQARLGSVESSIRTAAEEQRRLEASRLEVAARKGTLTERVADLGERRGETARTREAVVAGLRHFGETGLLRVALPDLETPAFDAAEEWSVTAALGLSRAAEQQLDGTDESDEGWSRAQQRVSSAFTELSAQMSRHGHTAFFESREEVMLARVRYLNDEVDIDQLADRLHEDVADRERLLSAREREILENHLVNEVAGHLHELLLAAEGQIDRMNRELAERKTSTGMQLRVKWRERPDAPAGLAAARGLMLRSDATWTEADRSAIGDFLQAQITEVRQADPTGGWQEHLQQALDYRHWHTFAVERLQNGQWRSASGPASGGEKALAVSVPLFAAASAHYNSAGPAAPRLILLDEAFAGIDDDSRAKSLGLLATFDLDVVMTSEREWGCYSQVPGLSIVQLSRIEGVDAVGVTRWRWDGQRRKRGEDVDPAARASSAPAGPVGDQSLFG